MIDSLKNTISKHLNPLSDLEKEKWLENLDHKTQQTVAKIFRNDLYEKSLPKEMKDRVEDSAKNAQSLIEKNRSLDVKICSIFQRLSSPSNEREPIEGLVEEINDFIFVSNLPDEQKKVYQSLNEAKRKIYSNLTKEERSAYQSLNKAERTTYLNLTVKEKGTYQSLNEVEKKIYLSLNGKERSAYQSLNEAERKIYLRLSVYARIIYSDLDVEERSAYQNLNEAEREIYSNLRVYEREIYSNFTEEERKIYLSLNGKDREIYSNFTEGERNAYQNLNEAERKIYLSLNGKERSVYQNLNEVEKKIYLILNGKERSAYQNLNEVERSAYQNLNKAEREIYLSLNGKDRNAYQNLNEAEREIYSNLNGKERSAYLSLNEAEREIYSNLTEEEISTYQSLNEAERKIYLSLTVEERTTYSSLTEEERSAYLSLNRKQRSTYSNLTKEEKKIYLSRVLFMNNSLKISSFNNLDLEDEVQRKKDVALGLLKKKVIEGAMKELYSERDSSKAVTKEFRLIGSLQGEFGDNWETEYEKISGREALKFYYISLNQAKRNWAESKESLLMQNHEFIERGEGYTVQAFQGCEVFFRESTPKSDSPDGIYVTSRGVFLKEGYGARFLKPKNMTASALELLMDKINAAFKQGFIAK
ncbi:MAG: hypothetical protein WDZ28_00855 [Simkaniaceae bacterium]